MAASSFIGIIYLLKFTKFASSYKNCRFSMRRWYGYILIVVNYAAIVMLMAIYKMKSPWYGPTFSPPSDYVQGPLSNDQGNNI